MMISDSERREVAARLRELPIDMYEVEELWEMKGLDTCCKDQTDYYLIHFALFGCFPADNMHPCDYEELHMRLADLIEPDSTTLTDPGEAALASVEGFIHEMRHSTEEEQNEYSAMLKKMSVELHPVDRDALLNLADEIDANGDKLLADSSLLVGAIGLMRCYANSIREALGEIRKE